MPEIFKTNLGSRGNFFLNEIRKDPFYFLIILIFTLIFRKRSKVSRSRRSSFYNDELFSARPANVNKWSSP